MDFSCIKITVFILFAFSVRYHFAWLLRLWLTLSSGTKTHLVSTLRAYFETHRFNRQIAATGHYPNHN